MQHLICIVSDFRANKHAILPVAWECRQCIQFCIGHNNIDNVYKYVWYIVLDHGNKSLYYGCIYRLSIPFWNVKDQECFRFHSFSDCGMFTIPSLKIQIPKNVKFKTNLTCFEHQIFWFWNFDLWICSLYYLYYYFRIYSF